jgi:hypothetical protein
MSTPEPKLPAIRGPQHRARARTPAFTGAGRAGRGAEEPRSRAEHMLHSTAPGGRYEIFAEKRSIAAKHGLHEAPSASEGHPAPDYPD